MKESLPNGVTGQPHGLDIIPEPVHPSKSTKFINYIVVSALVAVAIALAIFIKWSFADTNVLEIRNNPFPARVVADPTNRTGGIVFLTADYCKNSNTTGTVRVSYVSASREIFLPVAPEKLPKGCSSNDIPIVIPLNLTKDKYSIKFHVTYNINPLKKGIVLDFQSQPFTVGTVTPNQQ